MKHTQPDPPSPMFDLPSPRGGTFDPTEDAKRLNAQFLRVRGLMSDGDWRTLAQIAERTGDPEASVSARLQDMWGCDENWKIERRRVGGGGLHEYRATRPASP